MKVTLLDGGMGRELEKAGAPFKQPEWSAAALIEGPVWVSKIHQSFIDAGAQVITTNAYAVVPFHIGTERFLKQGTDLAHLAASLARQSADSAPSEVLVAGCLPPLFGTYEPDNFDAKLAPEYYKVLIQAQDDLVDLWLGETIGCIAEFEAIVDAIDRYETQTSDKKPIWVSFTVDDRPETKQPQLRSGEPLADVIDAVANRPNCQALLINCSKPEAIAETLDELNSSNLSIPFGAYANSFVKTAGAGKANGVYREIRGDMTPEVYRRVVEHWLALGASIVGGCCGIGPDHIKELQDLIEEHQ